MKYKLKLLFKNKNEMDFDIQTTYTFGIHRNDKAVGEVTYENYFGMIDIDFYKSMGADTIDTTNRDSKSLSGIDHNPQKVLEKELNNPKVPKIKRLLNRFEKKYTRTVKESNVGKTYEEFLTEAANKKTAVFSFGRMTPPTIGHQKLIDKVISVAKKNKADAYIFTSQSFDNKKNPIPFKDKTKFLQKMAKGAKVSTDTSVKTIFDAAYALDSMKYDKVILVVGDDRVQEFKKTIGTYVGHKDPSKALNFEFSVESAGRRDPNAKGVEGMSGTKMREAATAGDVETFKSGLSDKLSDADKTKLYNIVRKNLK